MNLKLISVIFIISAISTVALYFYFSNQRIEKPTGLFIKEIVDGDTVKVDGETIRLALVDAPERNEVNFTAAKNFVEKLCPLGSEIIVDEDDVQIEDRYDRVVAVIYCNGKNVNAELLEAGFGKLSEYFCDKSEFGDEDWAKKFGC